ncbi:hypothetical protein MMC19_006746 [Ptychographa xylographoides]|nr:hypothetical protein [Ptychographa xylographoides]
MAVNTLDTESGGVAGPWILACDYCNWTTLDIGIKFDKPTNVFGQLTRLRQERTASAMSKKLEPEEPGPNFPIPSNPIWKQDSDIRFTALKSFYNTQLATTTPSNPLMSPSGELNYNSPSSLMRIISIYTGTSSYWKKATGKSSNMRESIDSSEGLLVFDEESDQSLVTKLKTCGWQGTSSVAQIGEHTHPSRFLDEIWPVAALLKTKRSKRCRACRHILVKPEAKVQSTRYKIKLVAVNYALKMTLKPLQAPSMPLLDPVSLPPSKPVQFLLIVKNPMFDPVKVTLATSAETPGRYASKVTILCPQFDIGANIDYWDEALAAGAEKRASKISGKPKADPAESESKVAEAGKVWEKGRNWTTVVVEVVCARIPSQDEHLKEDEDVLEIPVFVRIEYEADVAADGEGNVEKDKREKRELAYWCVLGVGRIARSLG